MWRTWLAQARGKAETLIGAKKDTAGESWLSKDGSWLKKAACEH
jgi:hypothetical protein